MNAQHRSASAGDRLVRLADEWGAAVSLPVVILAWISMTTEGPIGLAALALAFVLGALPTISLVNRFR